MVQYITSKNRFFSKKFNYNTITQFQTGNILISNIHWTLIFAYMHVLVVHVCISVFTCACTLMYMHKHTCVHVCVWRPEADSGVFLPCSPCHIWRQSLPLEPRSCHFNKASEPACFGDTLSPPPKCRGWLLGCQVHMTFMWVLGIHLPVLTVA